MAAKEKRPLGPGKITLRVVLLLLAVILLIAAGYFAYLYLSYHRIPDFESLTITGTGTAVLQKDTEYSALTYNIGFGAYTPDFGFFMDGGTESWAWSKASVLEDLDNIVKRLKEEDADLMLIQEVDFDATRSYHVNERTILEEAFPAFSGAFAVNYDSPFLFYPFTQPHGASKAGMLTLSRFTIGSALRRSLPIEDSVMKFLDLDRCYSVSRIPVEGGGELVLYTLHLSAYTSDGSIATEQLKLLLEDMQSERAKGNWVIGGGDFNKDLLGNSGEIFGVSGEEYTWAQPFPIELLEGTGIRLADTLDPENPVPSCRNADGPYHEGQFVLVTDGFLLSDNVELISGRVIDTDFACSDHEPVEITFRLK